MRLHGFEADLQRLRDLAAGHACGDQAQDFALPRGRRQLDLALHGAPQLPADENLAAPDRLQSVAQLLENRTLSQVRHRAGAQRVPDVLLVVVHRDDDDARLRRDGHDQRSGLDAVQPRHGDVHQYDVGTMHGHGGQCLVAVGRFDHFIDFRHVREEGAQAAAHKRVVVREEQSHCDRTVPSIWAMYCRSMPAAGMGVFPSHYTNPVRTAYATMSAFE